VELLRRQALTQAGTLMLDGIQMKIVIPGPDEAGGSEPEEAGAVTRPEE
jgi:hypothetical protein